MTGEATPTTTGAPLADSSAPPYGIDGVKTPPGLNVAELANRLLDLPLTLGDLKQQEPATFQDSATVVYIDDPTAPQPSFGMIVILIVEPSSDASATVRRVREQRWGAADLHTVTAESTDGGEGVPAFVEFFRTFPPGQFVLPNQPVYFLIWYRAGEQYAYMVIGGSPQIRADLARALSGTAAGS